MKQPRPLKALAGLTDRQLTQLSEWVEIHSYRKAVELAREKFDRYIPKTTLQRYIAHGRMKNVLNDSPADLRAAREINRFAATAETNFTGATLHLLERRAFHLAAAATNKEDFQTLKDLLFVLQRHRSNDIHERRVRVQEEKLVLRKAEHAAKNATDGDEDDFSAAVDHVLKNHPAFLASSPTPTPTHTHTLTPTLSRSGRRKETPNGRCDRTPARASSDHVRDNSTPTRKPQGSLSTSRTEVNPRPQRTRITKNAPVHRNRTRTAPSGNLINTGLQSGASVHPIQETVSTVSPPSSDPKNETP